MTDSERHACAAKVAAASELARRLLPRDDEAVSVALEALCDAIIRARSHDEVQEYFFTNFVLNRLRAYQRRVTDEASRLQPLVDMDADVVGRRRYLGRITMAGAARELGISRSTLYRRLRRKS